MRLIGWVSFKSVNRAGKKRSCRSLVFSKVAPRTPTKKREYKVEALPGQFAETQPLSELQRV